MGCLGGAALGQVTSRLRFLPYVYVLAMRHPVHVAKQLATAELFAPGRMILGVGAGGLKEEFDLVDVPFDTGGVRTDEMLAIIRLLHSGENVEFDGECFTLPSCRMCPVPADGVPVMVGGDSDAALRRAARHDGWLGIDYEPDQLSPLIKKLNRYRSEIGRENQPFEIFAVWKPGVSHDGIRRLLRTGFNDSAAKPPIRCGGAALIVSMSRFAEQFMNDR